MVFFSFVAPYTLLSYTFDRISFSFTFIILHFILKIKDNFIMIGSFLILLNAYLLIQAINYWSINKLNTVISDLLTMYDLIDLLNNDYFFMLVDHFVTLISGISLGYLFLTLYKNWLFWNKLHIRSALACLSLRIRDHNISN